MKKGILFVLLAVAFTSQGQNLNRPKLDSFFDALATHNKGMGSVALTKSGKLIYTRSIGYAAIEGKSGALANEQTKYRIGSITKMFTSVMIFQLIEEGKLNITDKLSKWFPTISNADKISIGAMLNHHSGIFNFTDDEDYEKWNTQYHSEDQLVKMISDSKPAFEPGEKGEYSNSNIVLLGYIIERITKKTYAEELKTRITGRLGLTETYVGSKADIKKNEAYSYSYNDGWKQRSETDMSVPGGAGSIVSTPSDLDKFATALFTGKLISDKSLKQMTTISDGYGYGIFQFPFGSRKTYGHTGGIDGFASMLGYFPDDSVCFAYISNGTVYGVNDVAIAVLSIYYNMPFSIPVFDKKAYTVTEDLTHYTGVYASSKFPMKITLTKNGNNLSAQATGQSAFQLTPTAKDVFEFDAADIVLEFDLSQQQMTLKQKGMTVVFSKEK